MNLTNEQIQALKPVGKFMLVMQRWHHIWHGEAQYAEPRMPMVKLYSEETILSLLAEREADKALIAEISTALASANTETEKSNLLVDEIREERNFLQTLSGKRQLSLEVAESRIAELEARALTVTLPEPLMPMDNGRGELFMTPDNIEQGGYLNRDDVLRTLRKACAAAGITLVVGGEDAQG